MNITEKNYKFKSLPNYFTAALKAFFVLSAAAVMLVVNIVTSPITMIMPMVLIEKNSAFLLPLQVVSGSIPGLLAAYLIYFIFTRTYLISISLSLFAILPLAIYWFFTLLSNFDSLSITLLMIANSLWLTIAFIAIYLCSKKVLA